MRVRALRQAFLAAVPMVMLSQCAPQCTPITPRPPTVTSHDVTTSVAPDLFTLDITPDGRYVSYTPEDGGVIWRLDFQTGVTALAPGRLLIGDGWGVVDLYDPRSAALYDFASGTVIGRANVLAGWFITSVDSVSRDGQRATVTAISSSLNSPVAFLLDFRTGGAVRVDSRVPGSGASGSAAYGAIVAADGSSVAFTYRDGPDGCVACTDVWIARSGDVRLNGIIGETKLASPSTSNGRSANGDGEPVDISSDGRFVLFHSTASDLAGGDPTPPVQGDLYVRDVTAGTTAWIGGFSAIGDPFASAVSDDGTKVAFPTDRDAGDGPRPYVALADRTTGIVTVLTPVDEAHQLWWWSYVGMSGDGRRVAFDTTDDSGSDIHHLIVDLS